MTSCKTCALLCVCVDPCGFCPMMEALSIEAEEKPEDIEGCPAEQGSESCRIMVGTSCKKWKSRKLDPVCKYCDGKKGRDIKDHP